MNQKTLKITYGAMIVALFGVLLLINRQTGGMFNGILMFLLPIPMVAYGARYGWRAGLAAWGVVNLLEGYGNDNPGAKSQGIKQLMAGGGVILIGLNLIPALSGLLG